LIGSFLNVVIYRLPRGESVVRPGSHCPSCGHSLKAWDLVPIFSYLCLGGRCGYCTDKISPLYPLVEMLTAVGFFLIYLEFGNTMQAATGCLFTMILIVTAFTDINEGIIPDKVTYPGIVMGILLSPFTLGLKSSALGAIVFATIFLVTALVSRGGMGGGDIKLAGVIGAFTGLTGAVQTLFISSFAGGLWALLLISRGKANRKTSIKFGPFLAVSGWLVWLYGGEILDLYRNFFI